MKGTVRLLLTGLLVAGTTVAWATTDAPATSDESSLSSVTRHHLLLHERDPMLKWADARHKAWKEWVDYRNEDWKQYVAARNFWNNPWAETRKQLAKQRSEAIRKQMDDLFEQHMKYADQMIASVPLPYTPVYGFYGFPGYY